MGIDSTVPDRELPFGGVGVSGYGKEGGQEGLPSTWPARPVSKYAVVGLSEALAIYLGPKGVGVTCVCPSGVATNIVEPITVYGHASGEAYMQQMIKEQQ